LGLSDRQVRNLLTEWVAAGWLEVSDVSRKARAYRLPEKYRQFIGNLSAR
jgi:DNA-binding transcriptional regulator PaaX